jgi:hypothetical protein
LIDEQGYKDKKSTIQLSAEDTKKRISETGFVSECIERGMLNKQIEPYTKIDPQTIRAIRSDLLKRQNIYKQRGRISSLQYSQLHGRYPRGLNAMPGLFGMLSCYNYADKVNKYKN